MTPWEVAARVSEIKPRFLEGFDARDLTIILGQATPQEYRAGSLLSSEGFQADKVFLVLEGLARTFTTTRKGVKVVLLWIPPGEPAGGRAMLCKPTRYLVTTEAVTDTVALVWSRSAILPLAKQYPSLIENGLMIASDYLESYQNLHVAGSYDSAAQRVARALDNVAKGMGRTRSDGIEIDISNEELANQANVTIFTISRFLSKWQRKGFLIKSRGRLLVRSLEELIHSEGLGSTSAGPRISAMKVAHKQRLN
jgi:CRP-like cAMP-binding protein